MNNIARITFWSALLVIILNGVALPFDFKAEILGTGNSDLSINLASSGPNGNVTVNGVDMQPVTGFVFDWGDGTNTTGFFPANHAYSNVTRNYVVTVTAQHVSGSRPSAQLVVKFVSPTLKNSPLPATAKVTIPDAVVTLDGRGIYTPPKNLSSFDDSYFATITRSTAEGLLSLAAGVQSDFVNNDHVTFDSRFDQVVLLDPGNNFGYSIWYSSPVALALASTYLSGSIDWSSLFHEMGHNVTLNFPASFLFGGKIDGNANAIYSETLAQIFSFATTYELVNNKEFYGVPDDMALELGLNAKNSVKLVKSSYDQYLSSGLPFCAWNDPTTPQDDAVKTFMTLAYKFLEHAETEGMGYKQPLQRMMQLLGTFDSAMLQKYDPQNNSLTGATYRSTMFVAAMSYAFQKDLRAEFRSLDFPIDDQSYDRLSASAATRFLSAQLSGSGRGTVLSITAGTSFACDAGTCREGFPVNTALTLAASPSFDSLFSGWAGDCANDGADCRLTLNGNKTAVATFTMAPRAMIGATGYSSVNAAYASANSGAVIHLLGTELVESLILDNGKSIKLEGGYNADYSARTGLATKLKGEIIVRDATLRADRLAVK